MSYRKDVSLSVDGVGVGKGNDTTSLPPLAKGKVTPPPDGHSRRLRRIASASGSVSQNLKHSPTYPLSGGPNSPPRRMLPLKQPGSPVSVPTSPPHFPQANEDADTPHQQILPSSPLSPPPAPTNRDAPEPNLSQRALRSREKSRSFAGFHHLVKVKFTFR